MQHDEVLTNKDIFKYEPIQEVDLTDSPDLSKQKKKNRLITKINGFLDLISIWNYLLKPIENNCGYVILSYFKFIIYLININGAMILVQLTILILPYQIMGPSVFSQMSLNNDSAYNNKFTQALTCSSMTRTISSKFNWTNILDILEGRGVMEEVPIFIGYFFNKTYFNTTSNKYENVIFNTPLAYVIAFWLCIIISIITTLFSAGRKYKSYFVNEKEFNSSFGFQIFGAIDYQINSESRIETLIKNLSNKLKSQYHQIQEAKQREKMSKIEWFEIHLTRLIINIFFFTFLIGVYFAFFEAQSASAELAKYEIVASNKFFSFVKDYLPSATFAIINVLFIIINNKVIILEKYSPSIAIGVCLKRVILVQTISLVIYIQTLMARVNNSSITNQLCQHTNFTTCWETFVGQEFYRLILTRLISFVFVAPILQVVRGLLYSKFNKNKIIKFIGPPIFDIPTQGFQLISSQSVCWLGLWFCPVLPVLIIIKLVTLFFIQKILFLKNLIIITMDTSSVAGGQRFFLDWLLYSLAFVLIPIGYFFTKTPSRGCSPFRIYEISNETHSFSAEISNYMRSQSDIVRFLWDKITAVYIIIIILLILVIITYIVNAQSQAYLKYLSAQKNEIIMEERDNIFFVEQIVRSEKILQDMKETTQPLSR